MHGAVHSLFTAAAVVIWLLGAVSTRLRLDDSTVLRLLAGSSPFLIFESKTGYLAQYHAINCSRIDLEIPPTVSNTHLGTAGKEMINSAPRLSATQGEKSRWSIFSGV